MVHKVSKLTEAPIYPYAQTGAPFVKDDETTLLAGMLLVAEGYLGRRLRRPIKAAFTGEPVTPDELAEAIKVELVGWQRERAADGRGAATGEPPSPNSRPRDSGTKP